MAEGGGNEEEGFVPLRLGGSQHSSQASSRTSLGRSVEELPTVDALETSDSPVCDGERQRPVSLSVLPEPLEQLDFQCRSASAFAGNVSSQAVQVAPLAAAAATESTAWLHEPVDVVYSSAATTTEASTSTTSESASEQDVPSPDESVAAPDAFEEAEQRPLTPESTSASGGHLSSCIHEDGVATSSAGSVVSVRRSKSDPLISSRLTTAPSRTMARSSCSRNVISALPEDTAPVSAPDVAVSAPDATVSAPDIAVSAPVVVVSAPDVAAASASDAPSYPQIDAVASGNSGEVVVQNEQQDAVKSREETVTLLTQVQGGAVNYPAPEAMEVVLRVTAKPRDQGAAGGGSEGQWQPKQQSSSAAANDLAIAAGAAPQNVSLVYHANQLQQQQQQLVNEEENKQQQQQQQQEQEQHQGQGRPSTSLPQTIGQQEQPPVPRCPQLEPANMPHIVSAVDADLLITVSPEESRTVSSDPDGRTVQYRGGGGGGDGGEARLAGRHRRSRFVRMLRSMLRRCIGHNRAAGERRSH